jgi:hypothetical protein
MVVEGSPPQPTLLSRRLVAFCDILGFSDRLRASSLRDLHATYTRLIDHVYTKIAQQQVNEGNTTHMPVARVEFLFDSVVLVSNPIESDEAPRSVSEFMSFLSELFESSLGWQLPLRGAIGLGDVLEDAKRRVFLSEAIPDLVKAEKQQEWAGVTILRSAADVITDGLYGRPASGVPKNGTGHVVSYPIPTKQGSQQALALNWPYFCDARDLTAGLSFLTGKKHDETKRFVDFVRGLLPPPVRLPARAGTVETVRVRGFQSGFNIKFCDAEGNGADLPEGTTINFRVLLEQHGGASPRGIGGPG